MSKLLGLGILNNFLICLSLACVYFVLAKIFFKKSKTDNNLNDLKLFSLHLFLICLYWFSISLITLFDYSNKSGFQNIFFYFGIICAVLQSIIFFIFYIKSFVKLKKIFNVGLVCLSFLYFILFCIEVYFEISGFKHIWLQNLLPLHLWLRIFILLISFLFLFIVLKNKNIQPKLKDEMKIKVPLMLKATFYSLFTTIIPLTILAVFLVYSFNATFGIVDNKDFLAISKEVKYQIITTTFVLGVLSFFMSLIAIRYIQNRIDLIINAMRKLLFGNFESSVLDVQKNDEIGYLSFAFNKMASDLNNYSTEIKMYENLLEEKVSQRTLELENANKQAEQLLQEINKNSEQLNNRTGTITNQMKDALLVLDNEKNILRFNNAFLNIVKIKDDKLEGKNLRDLIFVKDYPDFMFMVTRMLTQKLKVSQHKIQLKPPLAGLLSCNLTSFDLGDDKFGIVIVIKDIAPPWGIVYNSETMEPIDDVVVRLYNEANNKIIAEERSDEAGRFMFYVEPGNYYVRLFKDGYYFPSKNQKGYHGEIINILNKEDSIIHFDILIDKI